MSALRSAHSLLRTGFCLLCLVFLLAGYTTPTRGEAGLPGDLGFGYGARIDPWGQEVNLALQTAADIDLDWIGIDFDWARRWPNRNGSLDLAELNQVMTFANENGLSVLISITHAPAWAFTPGGPDPELTAGLVAQLTRLYPEVLLTVELFPSANSYSGWGTVPNPTAYTDLLKTTANRLENAGRSTVLIAAGLAPIDPNSPGRDMDDAKFLQQLYDAGAAEFMPVVGVRLLDNDSDAMAAPWGDNPRVLRRYEAIRKVMLDNHHPEGRIWVTGFSWPAFTSNQNSPPLGNPEADFSSQLGEQTSWFNQAMQLMKSQLYIGVTVVNCLNPPLPAGLEGKGSACLIQIRNGTASLHPAYISMSQMISLAKADPCTTVALEKKITPFGPKILYKSSAP